MLACFYDPATGTFLTRDPANATTRSAYGYVYDNPLNNSDPSGLFRIPGTDWCVDIMDDNCNSNADGESLKDTPGRISAVCQTYCDDASNYAGVVAAGGAFACPFTGVGCFVAGAAGGVSVTLSLAHTATTCFDGVLDMYCGRSAMSTAWNAAFLGMGRGVTKALMACGDSLGESTVLSQLAVGDNGLMSFLFDTTERPDTYQRHASKTDPEPR